MNPKTESELARFVESFDAFLVECASYEEQGLWDVEENGYMSAYFQTDLLSVVLLTMSADGVFEDPETDVINKMFSTEYTPADLRGMHALLGPVIDDYCDAEATDAIATLSAVDVQLGESYRKLMLHACTIVSMSDGTEEKEEGELIERLRSALEV